MEYQVLRHGVSSWGGPGYRPEIITRALNLDSREELHDLAKRLDERLPSRELLPSEWASALLMAEVGFSSRVAGMGSQWVTVTGLDDVETIRTLRGLQLKLSSVIREATASAFRPAPT